MKAILTNRPQWPYRIFVNDDVFRIDDEPTFGALQQRRQVLGDSESAERRARRLRDGPGFESPLRAQQRSCQELLTKVKVSLFGSRNGKDFFP